MREQFFFVIGASILGAVFLLSVIELIFTVQRRKANEDLERKLKEIKASYTTSVNELLLNEEAKIGEVEEQIETLTTQLETERESSKQEVEEKVEDITTSTSKALEAAKAKAKKLEKEAKLSAEEYLETRKKEVETDLVNLVVSVTKKVLPESITYEIQKELVMRALKEIQTGTN